MRTDTNESGQAAIPLILFTAVVLTAAAGLAIDVSGLWFHRRAAQAAADAACQAESLDLLVANSMQSLPSGLQANAAGRCTGAATLPLCLYAGYNGYNSAGPGASGNSGDWNTVSYATSASVSGLPAPPAALGSAPYLSVTIRENVPTYFLHLVPGQNFAQTGATCSCGLMQQKAQAPVLLLHPTAAGAYSASAALNVTGSWSRPLTMGPLVGPQRAVQVNSSSSSAVTCGGAAFNTSAGGLLGTGADIGITGSEAASGSSCNSILTSALPVTGTWKQNVVPVPDPLSATPAPAKPAQAAAPVSVKYHLDGCPDAGLVVLGKLTGGGCTEYAPGYYPSGIQLASNSTAIFLPGLYYLGGAFATNGSNTLRVAIPCWSTYTAGYSAAACGPSSTAATQYTQGAGVTFYFSSTANGTANLAPAAKALETIDGLPSAAVLSCNPAYNPATAISLVPSLSGTVGTLVGSLLSAGSASLLYAPCMQNGTYAANPGDIVSTAGMRGILFFQDHGGTGSPMLGGSETLALGGLLYFHSGSYADTVQMQNTAGTFLYGGIIADKLSVSGAGATVSIPAQAALAFPKVALFR